MENNKYTIFTQDDVSCNTILIKMILEKKGYNVICSNDILKAMDLILQTKPDLILSDILEPSMRGDELCRMVKGNPLTKDIPFCYVTALSSEEYYKKAMACGADDYINLPLVPEQLCSVVERLLKEKDKAHPNPPKGMDS